MVQIKDAKGDVKMQCKHCKKIMKKYKEATTSPFSRHLAHCTKRPGELKQQTLAMSPLGPGSSSLSGVANWKYDQEKVRSVCFLPELFYVNFSFSLYLITFNSDF